MSDSLTIRLDRKQWNHVSLVLSCDIKITVQQKRRCSHSTASRLKGDIILLIHYNFYTRDAWEKKAGKTYKKCILLIKKTCCLDVEASIYRKTSAVYSVNCSTRVLERLLHVSTMWQTSYIVYRNWYNQSPKSAVRSHCSFCCSFS